MEPLPFLQPRQRQPAEPLYCCVAWRCGRRLLTLPLALRQLLLRRHTPDWLADPAIRPLIAGLSAAERHHGGEGALYVALKRRHR